MKKFALPVLVLAGLAFTVPAFAGCAGHIKSADGGQQTVVEKPTPPKDVNKPG